MIINIRVYSYLQEVRKVNQMDQARGIISVPSAGGTGVVILTGTAKKKVAEQKNKGKHHIISISLYLCA